MSDNYTKTSAQSDSFAADDVGGVKHPRMKVTWGPDGTANDADTASGKALPVQLRDATGNAIGQTGNALDVHIASGSSSGTEYTEDAAAASDPSGGAVILVRKDTPATTVSADGDNIAQRGTNYGAAFVQVVSSAGAFVDTFGGGTQYTEDAASASDPVGNALMLVRRDTLSGSEVSADGDNVAAKATSKGELYVKQTDAVPVTDNSGSLTVDNAGTFAVQAAQSGTWTVQPGNTANTTAWKVDASSVAVPITDNSGSLTVDNGGTFAVQATVAAGATNIAKAEDVASADADVGVPSMAVRKATPANTSGTDGDYEMLQMSAGRLWVDASGKTLTVDGSGVTQPVSLASVPSHAVTNAGTFAVQAAVTAASGSIASGALAAGSVASGAVASGAVASGAFASGSISAGAIAAGATSIADNEDVASADGDRGVKVLAVRKATPANTSGTDGDYEFLQVSAGRLWVDASGKTLTVDGSGVTQPVSGTVALGAGSAVVGHVIADSGSTTAVTGNVTVVQGTATNLNAAVVGTGAAGTAAGGVLTVQGVASMTKLLVTPDSVALPANQSVNVSQINAVTPLMGNGTTGTGSQRVTIASDNTAFTVNPASATAPVSSMNSAGANAGVNAAVAAVFDDTSPTAITENSFGFVRMSANRNLYGTIRDAAGNERGANVNSSSQLSVSVDNSNVSANIAQMNGVATTMGNGVAGTGVQRVTIASDSTGQVALAAGSATIGALTANQSVNMAQVGGTNTVTAGVAGTQAVGGSVATNVAIGTNPINNGAQAVSSENAAVTTGRMVQLVADLVGKQIVLPYANPENFVSGVISSAMTGTTTTSLVAAPASGLRNYITTLIVSNASTTVPTDILIQDGSGGTTLAVIPAPCGSGTGTGAAGAVVTLPTPLRQPTTATALFAANVTTGSSTKISAFGYKGA